MTRKQFHQPGLGRRFEQTLLFASKMHAGETKKGHRRPLHRPPLGVFLVLEASTDEDLAIAALLHDVVEDCGGLPVLIQAQRRFGQRVAHIVDRCTDSYTDPKPPWRQRKEQYLEKLRNKDEETRLVSAADKLYNARSIFVTIVTLEKRSGSVLLVSGRVRFSTIAPWCRNLVSGRPIA